MSFLNFPEIQHMRIMDTNEEIHCGSIAFTEHSELEYVRAKVFIHGDVGGARLRVRLDRSGHPDVYSDWVRVADIEDLSDKWIGWLRFDINRKPFVGTTQHDVYIEVDNYTMEEYVTYIGVGFDDYDPIYGDAKASFLDRPLALQLFTWEP